MSRRVVVTGIGCLAPNGNGREAFAHALARGESGIGRISLFDPEGLASTIAGEIKGFDPGAYVGAKDLRHVSRAVPMAIAASAEALADAGIDPVRPDAGGEARARRRARHRRRTDRVLRADVSPLLHEPGQEGFGLRDPLGNDRHALLGDFDAASVCAVPRTSSRPAARLRPTRSATRSDRSSSGPPTSCWREASTRRSCAASWRGSR